MESRQFVKSSDGKSYKRNGNIKSQYYSNKKRSNQPKQSGTYHNRSSQSHSTETNPTKNSTDNEKPKIKKRYFGFKHLEELSEKDPSEIVVVMCNSSNGFMDLFQLDKEPDWLFLIMKVTAKICSTEFEYNKQAMLIKIISSNFIDHLKAYILTTPTDKNRNRIKNINNFFSNCLTVFQSITKLFPKTAVERLKDLVLSSNIALSGINNFCPDVKINEIILSEMADLFKKLSEIRLTKEVEKEEKLVFENIAQFTLPPENFRELTVYPSPIDLEDENPFLRPNILKGVYQDVEHYLDVQFRLLREDFIGPLREGIQFYKENIRDKKSNETRKRIYNIRVYQNVEFVDNGKFVQDKSGFILNFNKNKKLRVNWEMTKRFMYGSLLVFTSDDFKTFFLGTVLERKKELLQEGKLVVELLDEGRPEHFVNLTMVESEVFFEPYRVTMEVLKKITSDNFPMEQYIISANQIIGYPLYIDSLPMNYYKIGNLQQFDILDNNLWPSMEQLGLDEMQYNAFKAALQNEFVVIQGPPGTGKTFIGLKIMRTLIENLYTEYTTSYKKLPFKLGKPILVVCYTNHALDQFMEGILEFTKHVVRVGGQSKSELMQQYSLINVTRMHRRTLDVSKGLRSLNNELKGVMHDINYYRSCSECLSSYEGILDLTLLKNGMPKIYHNFFQTSLDLLSWLFKDFTYFNTDPILYLKEIVQTDADLSTTCKVLHINNLSGNVDELTQEDNEEDMQYEADDPDLIVSMVQKNMVIHSLTVKQVEEACRYFKSIAEELQTEVNKNVYKGTKKETLQAKLDAKREILDAKLKFEIFERILNYFTEMLSLVHCNIQVPKLIKDLKKLNIADRWLLYFSWVENSKRMFGPKIIEYEKYYSSLHKRYTELKEMENIEILNKMHVVAMTTTGAAKHRILLEGLQSPIVVIEEAAEVLEAHIVASLTRHCEHLILIGDHKQLRPSNAVYKLAKNYNFDISLFERMVNNGVPCYTLGEQHRMRPEISSLITPSIYSNLRNHISVYNRDHILGVTKDLFFVNHNVFEKEVEEISSKSNEHEANFLIMLARHLILQDYKTDQVTILTTYSGQLFKLRALQKLHPILNGVKIKVVDNYQGEESDIILLSLVRSNQQGNVGFLKTENRICVALSRAKYGLYIIGNMQNLRDSGELWKKIEKTLVDQGSYGNELTLECSVHRYMYTKVSKSDDFMPIIEGGCTRLCMTLLKCGHECSSICHPYDRKHEIMKCKEPCSRSCDLNHPCKKKCYEDCGECLELTLKELPCRHRTLLPCSTDVETHKCQEKVSIKFDVCGHEIKKKCHIKDPKCTFPCYDRLECGHSCTRKCHKNDDPNHELYDCQKNCEKMNKNCEQNHKCKMLCYQECSTCTIKVKKILPCGHVQNDIPCRDDVNKVQCCQPCKRKLKCDHKCKSKCFEECSLCEEIVSKVIPDCGHQVRLKCKTVAERSHCTEKCTRKLPCGHNCQSLCKEYCNPDNCKYIVLNGFKNLACHHNKAWVFCCDRNKEFSPDSEYLLEKCLEPCTEILNCDDICTGNCGQCKQGRLHIPCKAKCNKVNVCNHTCDYPCKVICPPCNRSCSFSCVHSICKRSCGLPCVICEEPCKWKCEHLQCTKKCGEICNRLPCYFPCQVKLKCGHACIGFCGEPCPPLCRICDEEKVTEIIFGNEDDPDARFIYLEDCEHSIESDALEQWINQSDEEISMKQCPLCKTPILKTQRFMNQIKQIYQDIAKIKNKRFGDDKDKEIEEKKNDLIECLKSIDNKFDSMIIGDSNGKVKKLWNQVVKPVVGKKGKFKFFLSLNDIESLNFTLKLFDSLSKYKERIENLNNQDLKTKITDHFIWLLTVCFKDARRLSTQQKLDLNLEMVRTARLMSLNEVLDNPKYRSCINLPTSLSKKIQALVNDIKIKVTSCNRYSYTIDKSVQVLFDYLEENMKGLAVVSDEERKMIHEAMAQSFYGGARAQGHWMKCRNGHIYCITECGGAMEKSKCPVCGVVIGGQNHQYVEGTTVASEMDGARHLAWSQGNNMANYEHFF
ncbi:NFX1-type zinc finger-containing protein 1-like [Adelges cooleyi]|uniref:NFX1-type zinc finger-containing protein 1-like n=1 Tax=Adelges cooleyi TaxID=133065 RepID=UPI00217F9621|nr:NFX1-type zinc finger-containing protein 1-like [Adelges cooleyi]